MVPRLPAPEDWAVFAAMLAVPALVFGALYLYWRRRNSAAERERRRRMRVHRSGRITDGTVTDVTCARGSSGHAGEWLAHYHYWIGGVEYSTSQDISTLLALIPHNPQRLAGAVTVKYDPRNPFDSIILCEEWSGLRAAAAAAPGPAYTRPKSSAAEGSAGM